MTIESKDCRLSRLIVHDYGVIKLVDTMLPAGMTIVAGNNESGKSTLISAIAAVANGKKALVEAPVRDGADRATIEAELTNSDGTPGPAIKISQTAGGTYEFQMWTASGEPISSPMKQLQALRGSAGPDPVAMAWESDPRKVRAAILEAIGVDTDALDTKEKGIRDARTSVGRTVKKLGGAITEHGRMIPEVPAEEVSGAEIRERYETEASLGRKKEQLHAAAEKATDAVARKDDEITAKGASVDEATEEIERLQQRVRDLQAEAVALTEERTALTDAAEAAWKIAKDAPEPDLDPIRLELDGVEDVNQKVRQNAALRRMETELRSEETSYEGLTRQIEALQADRAKALKDAGLDIEGLDLSGGEPLIDGRAWTAASKGRRLRTCLQIVSATKANLRVAWTQEGDCLDDANLMLVAETCEETGLQLILERTGERDDGALMLECGEIKE